MDVAPVTLDDIEAAGRRIAGHAHRTPVMTSKTVDALAGRQVFFKCENLQRVGAFKFRGAMNAVLQLSDSEAARGVVTHSSGNHAQAIALAARTRGIPATIVMPSTAPAVKRAAVEGYGATVVTCEPTQQARESTAQAIVDQQGCTFIHAYDDPRIIAGQGTAALELLDEVGPLDALVTPVGGGGLLSGCTLAAKGRQPSIRVFAAEPAGADDAARGKATGQRVRAQTPDTIADGLLTTLGDLTWPVVRDLVDDVFVVDDAAIIAAMRLHWERMKLVVEPSGATGLAAVLSARFAALEGVQRVGVVISGGNVDLGKLPF